MDDTQPNESLLPTSQTQEPIITPKRNNRHRIILIFLVGFIICGLGVYTFAHIQTTRLSKSNPTNIQVTTSPTPTPITWLTYTDSEIGFSIKYPEPKREYDKTVFPVKQYISGNLSDGYRLQLTNDTLAKGYYFQITLIKDRTTTDFLSYWKKGQVGEGAFIFTSCTQTTCTGHYTSGRPFSYDFSSLTVSGKEAFVVNDRLSNYTDGKPIFTQRVYLRQKDYIMEIDKGQLDEANQILNSLTFL